MQIYINKNNQQLGPFEEAQVLEMLKNGQLSPNDFAIRHGEQEWRNLGSFYLNLENRAVRKDEAKLPAPKKSRKGLLLGCSGFFLIAILVAAVLGFLAYRNLFPADSVENLPNTVKNFKLDTRYPPKGNIWGSETTFVGLYSTEPKTHSVLYLMTVFADESAAQDAFREELAKSCKAGETPIYFSFNDKNGVEVSKGATCAAPLYIQKGNKLAALGGSGATADTLIEFAENLPFNDGTTMKRKGDK
jgi:GYF domain 2